MAKRIKFKESSLNKCVILNSTDKLLNVQHKLHETGKIKFQNPFLKEEKRV